MGCAKKKETQTAPQVIRIETTPSGAEVYVRGEYIGRSPISIQAPKNHRSSEAIRIEIRLEGHKNKLLLLGEYYPPRDRFIIGAGAGTGNVSIFGSKSIATTTDGYFKFPELVKIELEPN